jgi:hypothetical protein
VSIVRTPRASPRTHRARNSAWFAIPCAVWIAGCTRPMTTIPRMNSNFDAQPVGAPQQFPTPNAPHDAFVWLKQQPLSSAVVSNPSGGNWVLTAPGPEFVRDPDVLHQFLLATSEAFTTNSPAQMNGRFSIRLVGPGTVSFGIQATRGSARGFVGGGHLATRPFGSAGVGILLSPADIDNLDAFSSRDFPVTALATYNPGQVATFLFSIDQPSRAFNLSVGGGAAGSRSTTYGFSGLIERLELWLFLRQPASNTRVFVNDVRMDELR